MGFELVAEPFFKVVLFSTNLKDEGVCWTKKGNNENTIRFIREGIGKDVFLGVDSNRKAMMKVEPTPHVHIRDNFYFVKKRLGDADDIGCTYSDGTVCSDDCICRVQSINCSKSCHCTEMCTNRPFCKEEKVKGVKTQYCGWGIEVAEAIANGDFACISDMDTLARGLSSVSKLVKEFCLTSNQNTVLPTRWLLKVYSSLLFRALLQQMDRKLAELVHKRYENFYPEIGARIETQSCGWGVEAAEPITNGDFACISGMDTLARGLCSVAKLVKAFYITSNQSIVLPILWFLTIYSSLLLRALLLAEHVHKRYETFCPEIGARIKAGKAEFEMTEMSFKEWGKPKVTSAKQVTLAKDLAKELLTIKDQQREFFWGHEHGQTKLHTRSWSQVQKSDKEGGLNRPLATMNQALLAKQLWGFYHQPSKLLSQVFRYKYHPRNNVLEAPNRQFSSSQWKSMRNFIQDYLEWQIGDGRQLPIYPLTWIPFYKELQFQHSPSTIRPRWSWQHQRVSEFIIHNEWSTEQINAYGLQQWEKQTKSVTLPTEPLLDKLLWKHTMAGSFTVKSAALQLQTVQLDNSTTQHNVCYKRIWTLKCYLEIKAYCGNFNFMASRLVRYWPLGISLKVHGVCYVMHRFWRTEIIFSYIVHLLNRYGSKAHWHLMHIWNMMFDEGLQQAARLMASMRSCRDELPINTIEKAYGIHRVAAVSDGRKA